MKKEYFKMAKDACVTVGCWILVTAIEGILEGFLGALGSSSGGGYNQSGGSYTSSGPTYGGSAPRIYRPTGRARGYGPRTYKGTKSYW